MESHNTPSLQSASTEDEAVHSDSATPEPVPPLPDVVTLDDWEQVYKALKDRDPDPNLPSAIAAKHAEYNPQIIIAEGADERIAKLLEDDHRFIVNVNHIHEKDTGLAVRALYQTAFKRALGKTFVFAKHEHFNNPKYRAVMEKMGLAVFQPAKHNKPEHRRPVLAAGKRLEQVALYRIIKKGQHALMHGEGTRNTTENKNKVQQIRALLGRLAIGARRQGAKVAYLGIAVTYPDPDDPHNAVVKVDVPKTDFPDSHKDFAIMAQENLQELVDDTQVIMAESQTETVEK
jgi:1-acyl-sn-glycerol-3-phosphate acyltransferase